MIGSSRLAAALLATVAAPAFAAPVNRATLPAAAPTALVSFDIYLPLRNEDALDALIADQQKEGSANYHKWLTPADFKTRFGTAPESLARAQAVAEAAGLRVTDTGAHSFHVTGTAAQAGKLLGTSIRMAPASLGKARLIASKVTLPAALQAEGARVVAFSGLPLHQPFVTKASAKAVPDNRYSPDGPYWYNDLKQAYDYPSYNSFLSTGQRLDGTGVRVAVLMSDLLFPQDVAAYFNHENFTKTTGKAPPVVATALINGGGTLDGGGSVEATLDVQQVLGGAPGASVTLVSLPDLSDDNILDGYRYIVDQNRFDVVNSSFGACEALYTAAYNEGEDYTSILWAYDSIFKQGNAQGITFVASSGDNGALQCPSVDYFYPTATSKPKFVKGVSSPASSQFVTAVGGGNLITVSDKTLNSAYFSENGYGDPLVPYDPYGVGQNLSGGYWGPGGGVSNLHHKPDYQKLVNNGTGTQRTLPDIGMQVGGCPGGISKQPCGPDRSAVIVAYNSGSPDGGLFGVIGTSVSSPEFVGALALYIQKVGRVGNVNPYLYAKGAAQTANGGLRAASQYQYYRRDIPGFDGYYSQNYPSVEYNYIYGNGSPDIRKLFGMTNFNSAPAPQTGGNP